MKQQMRMYLRLLEDIYISGNIYTPNTQEMMPRYTPEAIGKYVVIKAYGGANHAVTMANRRSHYGIIIYVKNASII